MSVLDVLNADHPAHAFRGVVTERKGHYHCLKETDGDKRFLIRKDGSHNLDDRQKATNQAWEAVVIQIGGEAKLKEILDEEARVWLAREKEAVE